MAEGSFHELAENMVLSIEPGVYIERLGGFRHSDTIRITRDGYESLTNVYEDIESLTITAWKPWSRFKGKFIRKALGVEGQR